MKYILEMSELYVNYIWVKLLLKKIKKPQTKQVKYFVFSHVARCVGAEIEIQAFWLQSVISATVFCCCHPDLSFLRVEL